jgi:hypothetical protein
MPARRGIFSRRRPEGSFFPPQPLEGPGGFGSGALHFGGERFAVHGRGSCGDGGGADEAVVGRDGEAVGGGVFENEAFDDGVGGLSASSDCRNSWPPADEALY